MTWHDHLHDKMLYLFSRKVPLSGKSSQKGRCGSTWYLGIAVTSRKIRFLLWLQCVQGTLRHQKGGGLQEFLTEVQARLQHAVDVLRVPQWPHTATAAWKQAGMLLARRFGKALRLLRAIVAFDGILAQAPLVSLAFDALITRKVTASDLSGYDPK